MNVGTQYFELNEGKVLEGELLGLRPRDSQRGVALQMKSPVRCAHSGLFPFCPNESKLSTSKMKTAHQTSSEGFSL